MSREIKFRAWNRQEECWYNPRFIEMNLLGQAILTHGLELFEIIPKSDIEQYTGLKDKNGKEIYDGDIVKARWYRAKNARLDTKGEVKFNDGWFYIKDDPDGQDRLGVPVHNCYNIEVIGNVHENGELLK